MRKFILIALAVLAAIVVVFLVVVALQPADYRVERSATIAAPASEVFPHVNDLHNWEAWSPWAKLDPNVKNTFEGPSSGKGAVFNWSGNSEVGEGSMTITESRPNELIRLKLAFVKPMEDSCNVEFTFKEKDDQTKVTWAMYGTNNFVGKAMCLFMDLDQMMGSKFDEGLANLKSLAEKKNGDKKNREKNGEKKKVEKQ